MSTWKLLRLGASAAIVGGALLIIPDLWGALSGGASDTYTGTSTERIFSVLFLLGKLLLVPGVVALYLYQAQAAGKLGLVAFSLALLGTTLMVGSDWSEVFIAPILHEAVPTLVDQPPTLLMVGFLTNFALESVGWLLFGIVTWRARVFPRAAAAALVVGVALPLVGPPWSFVVWNGAIVALGFAAFRPEAAAPALAAAPSP